MNNKYCLNKECHVFRFSSSSSSLLHLHMLWWLTSTQLLSVVIPQTLPEESFIYLDYYSCH